MANRAPDPVFQLIQSLTQSEKRHFRLFTGRQGSTEGLKFLQLFDALDAVVGAGARHDEARLLTQILTQVPSLKRAQLANLKANLYRQLLASLRLFHAGQNVDIQLREQLDFARVLYNKGLYQPALRMLARVKQAAQQAELPHVALTALDFEKLIESQHITRSLQGRADELAQEASALTSQLAREHALSNASLRLYGLYLQAGHARNQADHERVAAFFRTQLPAAPGPAAGFWEQLYHAQAQVWFHTINQDFRACYRHAQRWVRLFEAQPARQEAQPMLYLKGLHNLLLVLFNMLYYSRFKQVLRVLEDYATYPARPTPNTEALLFQYLWTNRINLCFLEGRFTEGVEIVPELLEQLARHRGRLDLHRTLVFYYKIACLYFGSGQYAQAISYLNRIIEQKDLSLREDLQCFARILNLVAHYEAGLDLELERQVRSVYHFLGRMNDQQPMQVAVFQFLRRVGSTPPGQLRDEFRALKARMEEIAADPYERRPFLYFDLISWLESKISGRSVEAVIQQKFLTLK